MLRKPMLYLSLYFKTHRQLVNLANEDCNRISGLGRPATSALRVHRALTGRPITAFNWLVEEIGFTPAGVNGCLAHLERLGIVRELTSRQDTLKL